MIKNPMQFLKGLTFYTTPLYKHTLIVFKYLKSIHLNYSQKYIIFYLFFTPSRKYISYRTYHENIWKGIYVQITNYIV